MKEACKNHTAFDVRCYYLGSLLKYVLEYSVSVAKGRPNWQNAGRHFAMIVMSAMFIGIAGAAAIGRAHEIGTLDPQDSRRDLLNNDYALGWYQRHTSWANSFVGHVRSRGDMKNLFWHGVSLYRRGYMYGICVVRGVGTYVGRGPCH
jgi:hypothetical protein